MKVFINSRHHQQSSTQHFQVLQNSKTQFTTIMFSLRNLRFGRKVGYANISTHRRKEPSRMKSLFRKCNSSEWETWTDFHKKYQSDVYRKSANNQFNEYSSKAPSKKVSSDGENSFFTKMLKESTHQPKTARRHSSVGGGGLHQRRRQSMIF